MNVNKQSLFLMEYLFSSPQIWKKYARTHPTLTQHPPLSPFSISKVFLPYHPAALLAVPLPPDPPPITIYSNSSGSADIGAMVENFLRFVCRIGIGAWNFVNDIGRSGRWGWKWDRREPSLIAAVRIFIECNEIARCLSVMIWGEGGVTGLEGLSKRPAAQWFLSICRLTLWTLDGGRFGAPFSCDCDTACRYID